MGNVCESGNNRDKLQNISPSPNFYCYDTLAGHEGKITCLKELNNKNVITGSNKGEFKIWNLNNVKCEKSIKVENQILCLLEFKPNKLLFGKSNNNIELWDINYDSSAKKIHTFRGHRYWVTDLTKCDENNYFASSSNDGDIRIWDFNKKDCIRVLNNNNINILCLIKLNNGYLCSGNADFTIKIWDWNNQICEDCFRGHINFVKSLCQLKTGEIVSGSDDTTIRVWKNNNDFYELRGHLKAVRCVCLLYDQYISSASFDGTIKIWNLYYKSCIQTLNGHRDFVTGIIFHTIGILISASNDKTMRLWMNTKELKS